MCIVESNPYNRLLDFYSFEWHEIIFNSRILLPYKTNDIVTKNREGFIQRRFSCTLNDNTKHKRVILEKEFLVIERTDAGDFVIPFFTQEGGPEYRGGRLIHSNPPTIFNEGFQPMYFSIHLANIGKNLVDRSFRGFLVFGFFFAKAYYERENINL